MQPVSPPRPKRSRGLRTLLSRVHSPPQQKYKRTVSAAKSGQLQTCCKMLCVITFWCLAIGMNRTYPWILWRNSPIPTTSRWKHLITRVMVIAPWTSTALSGKTAWRKTNFGCSSPPSRGHVEEPPHQPCSWHLRRSNKLIHGSLRKTPWLNSSRAGGPRTLVEHGPWTRPLFVLWPTS